MQLGRLWTILIVVQVAFAVAVLPSALFMAWRSISMVGSGPGFAAEPYLIAGLLMDEDISTGDADRSSTFLTRYAQRFQQLLDRVRAEPDVESVTCATTAPGQEPTVTIEVEAAGSTAGSPSRHDVRSAVVGAEFFDVFGVPMLAGRAFTAGDLPPAGADSRAAIVNRRFVDDVLGGGNALGRRVRYPSRTAAGPWLEIVGVVADLPAHPVTPGEVEARIYTAMAPGRLYGTRLAVRLRSGDGVTFTERLRAIATNLDPALRMNEIVPLTHLYARDQEGWHWGAVALGLVTSSVVLLSAAGVYALMSFTITRRRREIGIRIALGADRGQILRSVFARAIRQLSLGVAAGAATAMALDAAAEGQLMGGQWIVLVPIVSLLMIGVGLLAALGPARRGLRINPTEALRAE